MSFDFISAFRAGIENVGSVYRAAKDAGFNGNVRSNADGTATLSHGGVFVDYQRDGGTWTITERGRASRGASTEVFPDAFVDPAGR